MAVHKNFPIPPGGRLTCEDGQTAIVKIRPDGSIVAACDRPDVDTPYLSGNYYSLAFINWLLTKVTGDERFSWQPLTDQDRDIFRNKRFTPPVPGGEFVRVEFEVPSIQWLRLHGEQPLGS